MGREKERHMRMSEPSGYTCCCMHQISYDEIAHFKDYGVCPRCTYKMENED